MALVMYDWECSGCELVFETLGGTEQTWKKCPRCGKRAKKLISARGSLNEMPSWMHRTMEVVDKEDRSPEAMELRRTGTRSALKRFMRKTGMRFMEDGEETFTQKDRDKITEQKLDGIVKEVARKHEKRLRIEVRG